MILTVTSRAVHSRYRLSVFRYLTPPPVDPVPVPGPPPGEVVGALDEELEVSVEAPVLACAGLDARKRKTTNAREIRTRTTNLRVTDKALTRDSLDTIG